MSFFSEEFDRCIREFAAEFPSLKEALEADPYNEELRKQAEELAERTNITFWFVEHVTADCYDDWGSTSWAVYIPKGIDTVPSDELNNIWRHSNSVDIRLFIHGESGGNERGEWINSNSC